MIGGLRLRLGELLARLRRPRHRAVGPAPAGKARQVIVVRPRDPRFREVIYVLREETLPGPGAEREELLRQALEAARGETERSLPPPPRRPLWPAALLLLGILLALRWFQVI